MKPLPAPLLALGWALVHFVWQGALIALALAAVRAATRRASAELRHATAAIAMLSLLVVPIAGFALGWVRFARPEPRVDLWQLVAVGATAGEASRRGGLEPLLPWILAAWCAGVLLLLLRWSYGELRLRRDVLAGARPVEGPLAARATELVRRVGLSRRVRILVSSRVGVPLLVGWLRPVVLLPLGALTRLPAEFLEYAILHELMHLRRLDPLIHRVQLVAETLLFYHPAVWWVSRVLTREREHCCDAAVVALTRSPVRYARALAELEASRVPAPQHALASSGGHLMSRIQQIVRENPRAGRRRSAGLPATVGVALSAVVIAVALVAAPGVIADGGELAIPWLPAELRQWEGHFEEAAERHGVDPGLLAIITLVESGGNPEAVSSAGSLGLMQIMPKTGQKIAHERGIDGFSVEELRDPATNIDFGAWYLARHFETFGEGLTSDEAVSRVAAAYNGGPKRLRAHLRDGAPLSLETSRYQEVVRRLWSEREESRSPTFEELWSRRLGNRSSQLR
jgi:soluble lytic murein transglycosylase-like protein